MGHRYDVLEEPRRIVSDRIVRPHRVHRHIAVARSGDEELRDLPVEPRASRRQGRRHAAAEQGRDGGGSGVDDGGGYRREKSRGVWSARLAAEWDGGNVSLA